MHTESSETAGDGRAGPNTRHSAEERREQLLDAAVEVIAEEGLNRATTRAITDRAGLALGAFHYVFASKDELLEAVIHRVVHDIDASMAETASALTAGAEVPLDGESLVIERLRGFLQQAWPYFERSRSLQLAQYELALHALRDPAKHHLAVQQYEALVSRVSGMLRGLADTLDDEASDDLARFVVATIDGLLLQWLVEQDHDAAEIRLGHYLDVLPAIVAAHTAN
ncbi:MAG: TetR/AcrR family transcriptional regulator [Nitriliruptoraceae bacterium]